MLIAIGAILAWGVNAEVEGLNVGAIGVILMVVGLIGLLLTLVFFADWGPWRRRRTYATEGPDAVVEHEHRYAPRRRTTVVEDDVAPGPPPP